MRCSLPVLIFSLNAAESQDLGDDPQLRRVLDNVADLGLSLTSERSNC
jgi:hypothetical protein